ncbi:hypothetical protein RIF29_33676 [Crotalaria pallida]|uniref:Oxidoreductase-like domain-containing protein n=1 Tax=Crotalaria pallida TaxID=3830 RepID=A0AAN9E991_CROPI
MRLGTVDLTQKLIPFHLITTPNTFPLPRTTTLFFQQPHHHRMAESAPTNTTPAPHPIESEKKDQPSPKQIPPPPEKPEPGDCCGSGCVRCVWDVYYDELEEYNKLYKQDPNPKS